MQAFSFEMPTNTGDQAKDRFIPKERSGCKKRAGPTGPAFGILVSIIIRQKLPLSDMQQRRFRTRCTHLH